MISNILCDAGKRGTKGEMCETYAAVINYSPLNNSLATK